ncbi:MAG: hypothetical protein PHI32_10265 [Dysgonamonadaceae bacterium]|nr:hypothetical protein [Dysgonamonadaceae bacterium]
MKRLFYGLLILIIAGCGQNNTRSNKNEETKFSWDFSKPKKLIYSYSQIINNETKMSRDEPTDKAYMNAIGNLNVKIKDNNLADLSLTNIEIKSVDFDKDGNPQDTMIQKAPPQVIQDMEPDGSFSDSNIDIMFKILFPLPSKDLKEGEKDKVAMQTPFNANGSRLYVKGFNTIEFSGYKTINDRECVVLNGIIDISEMDVPEEIKEIIRIRQLEKLPTILI